jgi:hypothetical protein
MKGRIAFAALALTVALGSVQAAPPVPLIERERVVLVTDPQNSRPSAVKSAIVAGSTHLGWSVKEDKPGKLTLHYNKQDKHMVTVDVLHDATGYQIKYVDSVNMNYRDGMITPQYNRWTANLIKHIALEHARSTAQ